MVKNKNRGKRSVGVELPINEVTREYLQGTSGYTGFRRQFLTQLRREAVVNPILRSFVRLVRDGVIGNMPLTPNFSGISKKNRRELLQRLYKEFSNTVAIDGKTTMRVFQKQLVENYLIDGRVFGLLMYSNDYPFGVAVQPVSREALADIRHNQADGVRWGMKYDKRTRRLVSYLFYENGTNPLLNNSGAAFNQFVSSSGETVEIPESRVLDLKNAQRADAWDNYPSFLLAAYYGIKNTDELDKVTLQQMRASACKSGFFTKEAETGTNDDDEVDYELPENLTYGNIAELPAGMKFEAFDPKFPSTDIVEYRKQLLRASIAAGGLDYNSVMSDATSVNFSSLRHFWAQSKDTIRSMQEDVIEMVLRPLLLVFLDVVMSSGRIKLTDEEIMAARTTAFSRRGYPFIDPAKEAMSKKAQLSMFAVSPQDVAEESGRSVEDVLNDIGAVSDLVEKVGIEKVERVLKLSGLLTADVESNDEDSE